MVILVFALTIFFLFFLNFKPSTLPSLVHSNKLLALNPKSILATSSFMDSGLYKVTHVSDKAGR